MCVEVLLHAQGLGTDASAGLRILGLHTTGSRTCLTNTLPRYLNRLPPLHRKNLDSFNKWKPSLNKRPNKFPKSMDPTTSEKRRHPNNGNLPEKYPIYYTDNNGTTQKIKPNKYPLQLLNKWHLFFQVLTISGMTNLQGKQNLHLFLQRAQRSKQEKKMDMAPSTKNNCQV